jgi:signal peptidase II
VDRVTTSQLTPGRVAFAVMAVLVFIVDRVTKGLVVAYVPSCTEVRALPFVWITNAQNSGAAFSIAPNATPFFLLASIAVAGGLIWYMARTPVHMVTAVLLGLVLGGTLGNGYDRLVHGTVTDFVALHFWPVFNMADAAISVGVVLLLLWYLLRQRPD